MAEKFRFFDAVQDEFGQYDREYNAQEFTDYFKALVTTGIMKGVGNELRVTANGSNMITKVDTGIAFLLGRYYENDSFKDLTHDTETLGNSRIDRIVVRMDLSTDARYVKTFIKKGVPSTNPVAPTLTQTANLYEISLAQVRIVGGQTFIATNNVTDERGKDIICPWAGSRILPNFDNNALAEHVNNTLVHVLETQEEWIPLILQANWENALGRLSCYKDQMGMVHVYGAVKTPSGHASNSMIISTLPVGYRPSSDSYYTNSMSPGTLNIKNQTTYANGNIMITAPNSGAIYIISNSFRAEN